MPQLTLERNNIVLRHKIYDTLSINSDPHSEMTNENSTKNDYEDDDGVSLKDTLESLAYERLDLEYLGDVELELERLIDNTTQWMASIGKKAHKKFIIGIAFKIITNDNLNYAVVYNQRVYSVKKVSEILAGQIRSDKG